MSYTTSYTIWSHGRLLGETNLGFVRCMPKIRTGFFHPTELGERLMPIACGVSPALRKLAEASRVIDEPNDQADGGAARVGFSATTTEYADLVEAVAHREGLDLELRGARGEIIPVEDIAMIDTEYLLSLVDENKEPRPLIGLSVEEVKELEEQIDEAVQEMLDEMDFDEPWRADDEDAESTLPRYQIQVHLFDDCDVP